MRLSSTAYRMLLGRAQLAAGFLANDQRNPQFPGQSHRHDGLHREIGDGDRALVVLRQFPDLVNVALHDARDSACIRDRPKGGGKKAIVRHGR